jgi:diaminopimelate epimerase
LVDDLASVDVTGMGAKTEINAHFPNKTNVHFVQVIDRSHIRLSIWEHGGDIQLGSGSCCCGAVVDRIRRGLVDDAVEMACDGGTVRPI